MDTTFYPEDAKFYYKKVSGKRTLYRSIVDDKVVARDNIPKHILSDIKTLEDMQLNNYSDIEELIEEIELRRNYIEGYNKYISKLKDDLKEMTVEEIPINDPRRFYYKRKIADIRPIIYGYCGYVSKEDMKYKKELLGDLIRSAYKLGKSVKAYPSESIIDDIGPFDSTYTFLSKKEEIDVSLFAIKDLKETITQLEAKLNILRKASGGLNRKDIIREYYQLKSAYLERIKKSENDIYDDLLNKAKYNSFEVPNKEKVRNEAKMRTEAERARAEMLRRNLDEARSNFEKEVLRQKMEEERKRNEEYIRRKLEEEMLRRQREEVVTPKSFLQSLGITDKPSWRKWLIKNHPDRAGPQNNTICQKVIDAGRSMGY